MLSFSFATLALSTLVLAGPAPPGASLSYSIAGPGTSVNSVSELRFTASVTNSGTEDLKVLKYNSILDSLPTRSFTVTKDGAAVPFTGVKLSVDALDESAWVIIPAGQTVTVEHDVSSLYDFASSGTGAFSFEPLTEFQIAGRDTTITGVGDVDVLKATGGSPLTVEVTSDVSKRELALNKRAVFSCSNTSQRSFIQSSYNEAKSLASQASSYVSSRGSGDALYRAYYKTASTGTVTGVFNRVASESGSRTYSCTDSYGVCGGGVIAYTVIATTNIYYCSIFFNHVAHSRLCSGTSVASRNIRGGTTLHEITHATSGTDDVGYGCAFDQSLSASQAVRNADNYNCFAAQVYQNTQC